MVLLPGFPSRISRMNLLGIPHQPDTSRHLGEIGMAKTLEAEREEWITEALQALKVFSRMPAWCRFKCEDFRAWYTLAGGSAPHHFNVWGALTNRAARDGLIRFTGSYAPSVSPKTHGHPVKVWEGTC